MSQGAKVRAMAAKTIAAVITGSALDEPLAKNKRGLSDKDQSFLAALAYGGLRRMPRHQAVIECLLRNPKKPINPMMQALLIVGLEQIVATRVPPHAAVSATVAASRFVNQQKGSGFLNAILRNYLRDKDALEERLQNDERFVHAHPAWLVNKFKQDWPLDWQGIIDANNGPPPFWLRVNKNKTTRDHYLTLLHGDDIEASVSPLNDVAIRVHEAIPVERLPMFEEGWVSVQDLGAQLAGELVAPVAGARVLDACAAPGGKAMHIMELCPEVQLTAMDISQARLQRVEENCQRLGFQPQLVCADAAAPADWWDNEMFDTVLVDAPCTGTGVIRRHPDIKVLRRPKDATGFAGMQRLLLEALWQTVTPGGRMIYATCSVFPEENEAVIESLKFLDNAQTGLPEGAQKWGKSLKYGVQILPGETMSDGFYYAVLHKPPN